jgi:hypothetical protein
LLGEKLHLLFICPAEFSSSPPSLSRAISFSVPRRVLFFCLPPFTFNLLSSFHVLILREVLYKLFRLSRMLHPPRHHRKRKKKKRKEEEGTDKTEIDIYVFLFSVSSSSFLILFRFLVFILREVLYKLFRLSLMFPPLLGTVEKERKRKSKEEEGTEKQRKIYMSLFSLFLLLPFFSFLSMTKVHQVLRFLPLSLSFFSFL